MSYSAEVLADSPLVYWRLGDGSGTTAADSSGNGRSTTWSGAPTWTTGLLVGDSNGAAKPNSQFASLADAAWMHVSAVTVEVLVKYDTVVASAGIVDRYGPGNTGVSSWLMYTPGSKFTFLIRDNFGDKLASSTAAISTGTTYHVVGRADGSTVKLFVNGTEVASTATGPLEPGTAAAVIGKAVFNGVGTNGTIDEVAIYGTALSPTRIAAHYAAATSAGSASGGSGSLSLSGSGAGTAPDAGAGSLSLSGSGGAAAQAASAASLSLSGLGSIVPPVAAAGTGSLSLSASGGATASPTATASLNLVATGTALAILAAAGTGTLSLSASGSAVMSSGGTGLLTLAAVGDAVALFLTDTSNAFDGLDLICLAHVTLTRPPTPPPPRIVLGERYDKAVPYPVPVMVDGRPT